MHEGPRDQAAPDGVSRGGAPVELVLAQGGPASRRVGLCFRAEGQMKALLAAILAAWIAWRRMSDIEPEDE